MARFKVGQQVVCISTQQQPLQAKDEFGRAIGNPVSYYPKYGEIVTVVKYSTYHRNCIELVEYPFIPHGWKLPYCYPETRFAPLMDISELTEILEQQPEHHEKRQQHNRHHHYPGSGVYFLLRSLCRAD